MKLRKLPTLVSLGDIYLTDNAKRVAGVLSPSLSLLSPKIREDKIIFCEGEMFICLVRI